MEEQQRQFREDAYNVYLASRAKPTDPVPPAPVVQLRQRPAEFRRPSKDTNCARAPERPDVGAAISALTAGPSGGLADSPPPQPSSARNSPSPPPPSLMRAPSSQSGPSQSPVDEATPSKASSPEDVVSIRQSQVGLGTYTPPPTSPPSSRTADVVPVCCLAGPPPPPPPLSHQGIWPAKDQDMSSSTQMGSSSSAPTASKVVVLGSPAKSPPPLPPAPSVGGLPSCSAAADVLTGTTTQPRVCPPPPPPLPEATSEAVPLLDTGASSSTQPPPLPAPRSVGPPCKPDAGLVKQQTALPPHSPPTSVPSPPPARRPPSAVTEPLHAKPAVPAVGPQPQPHAKQAPTTVPAQALPAQRVAAQQPPAKAASTAAPSSAPSTAARTELTVLLDRVKRIEGFMYTNRETMGPAMEERLQSANRWILRTDGERKREIEELRSTSAKAKEEVKGVRRQVTALEELVHGLLTREEGARQEAAAREQALLARIDALVLRVHETDRRGNYLEGQLQGLHSQVAAEQLQRAEEQQRRVDAEARNQQLESKLGQLLDRVAALEEKGNVETLSFQAFMMQQQQQQQQQQQEAARAREEAGRDGVMDGCQPELEGPTVEKRRGIKAGKGLRMAVCFVIAFMLVLVAAASSSSDPASPPFTGSSNFESRWMPVEPEPTVQTTNFVCDESCASWLRLAVSALVDAKLAKAGFIGTAEVPAAQYLHLEDAQAEFDTAMDQSGGGMVPSETATADWPADSPVPASSAPTSGTPAPLPYKASPGPLSVAEAEAIVAAMGLPRRANLPPDHLQSVFATFWASRQADIASPDLGVGEEEPGEAEGAQATAE